MFDIPIIGPALEWVVDTGAEIGSGGVDLFDDAWDYLFGPELEGPYHHSEEGPESDSFFGSFLDDLGSNIISSGKQSRAKAKASGTSAIDIYNAKQLTQLRKLSTQRSKQEAVKNLQRELRTSTQRKEDNRQQYVERARQPMLVASRSFGRSTMKRWNDQVARIKKSKIPDRSVSIPGEAPRYTKSSVPVATV
tara:strand:+ start:50 stop:628 length:579 start_codon:yes stop_codon:yes gene_type:complete